MAGLLIAIFPCFFFRFSMTSIAGLIERSIVNCDFLSFRCLSQSVRHSHRWLTVHTKWYKDREHVARDDAANISTITTSYECFCLRCRSYCWQRVHCSHRIFRCQRIFEIFILFNFMRIEEKKRQPIAHIDLKKKKAGFCWLLKFKLIINFWKEKKRNRTTHDRI